MIQKREWQTNNVPSSHYYSLCKFKVGVCAATLNGLWYTPLRKTSTGIKKNKGKKMFVRDICFIFLRWWDHEGLLWYRDANARLRTQKQCCLYIFFAVCKMCGSFRFVFVFVLLFLCIILFGTCWMTFFFCMQPCSCHASEKLFRSRLVTVQTCALSVVVRRI